MSNDYGNGISKNGGLECLNDSKMLVIIFSL